MRPSAAWRGGEEARPASYNGIAGGSRLSWHIWRRAWHRLKVAYLLAYAEKLPCGEQGAEYVVPSPVPNKRAFNRARSSGMARARRACRACGRAAVSPMSRAIMAVVAHRPVREGNLSREMSACGGRAREEVSA